MPKRKAVKPTAEQVEAVAKAIHGGYADRYGGVGKMDANRQLKILKYLAMLPWQKDDYRSAARAAIAAWERVRGKR